MPYSHHPTMTSFTLAAAVPKAENSVGQEGFSHHLLQYFPPLGKQPVCKLEFSMCLQIFLAALAVPGLF